MAWRTVNFSANGGTLNSTTPLYYQTSSPTYWASAKNSGVSYRVYSITKPTRSNYIFSGFWSSSSGSGTQYVSASGSMLHPSTAPTDGITVYAGWNAYATITLNRNGGSGGTASFYYKLNGGGFYSNTALTSAITSITPPTGAGVFRGYSLNGVLYIDEQGRFTQALLSAVISANYTLTAQWTQFGDVTDYFGFASANLIPILSDSGDGKKRTCVANATWSGSTQDGGAGRYSRDYSSPANDPTEVSGVWRNPTVTYRVVGDLTFSTQLGKAYSGSGSSISGYMITSVRVQTAVGKFPTITISAVANEGVTAINLFSVSISVVARARAQYLMSAVSGGGNLQTCDIEASCTPVVCAENNMPCASDVVGGKYVARATTYAPGGDAAPTAGNGFTSIGEPKACGDKDYPMWSITAEKEIT